jgi:hypothetical protein
VAIHLVSQRAAVHAALACVGGLVPICLLPRERFNPSRKQRHHQVRIAFPRLLPSTKWSEIGIRAQANEDPVCDLLQSTQVALVFRCEDYIQIAAAS